MSVKVENTENKNEVKLEITVDAKVFDEGIVKVYNKNAKWKSNINKSTFKGYI